MSLLAVPDGGVGGVSSPTWPKRKRRAYSRMASGIRLALAQGFPIRRHKFEDSRRYLKGLYVLTLTSSSDSDVDRLKVHFNVLVKRLRRRFGSISYYRLRTYEGVNGGVLHVLLKSNRLDIRFVRDAWFSIHSAVQMRIDMAYGNLKRVISYLCGYLNHHDKFRYGYSVGWLPNGWIVKWKECFKGRSVKMGVWYWNNYLDGFPELCKKQVSLEGLSVKMFDELGWKI